MINGKTEISTPFASVMTFIFFIVSFLLSLYMFFGTIDHWFEKILAGISWLGLSVAMFISTRQLIDLEKQEQKNIKKA